MYIMHPVPYCRTDINLRQLSFLKMFLVTDICLIYTVCFKNSIFSFFFFFCFFFSFLIFIWFDGEDIGHMFQICISDSFFDMSSKPFVVVFVRRSLVLSKRSLYIICLFRPRTVLEL